MITTKMLEEKFEYLFNVEMRDRIKLHWLNIEMDVRAEKIEECWIFIQGEYIGPQDSETYAIIKVIQQISDLINEFLSKYKLLPSGKITTKEKENYYIDDLNWLKIEYFSDEKWEFVTSVKIIQDE